MRTLILCLLAIPFVNVSGQETRIVMNSDGTYSRVTILYEDSFDLPEDLKPTFDIMQRLVNGETIIQTDSDTWASSTTSFSSEYPFFIDTYSVVKRSYSLEGNEVIRSAAEHTYDTSNPVGFWILALLLLGSLSLTLVVPYKSLLSLSLTGAILVLGIVASHFFSWWGFGFGVVSSALISGWNAQECYFNSYEPFWPGFGGGLIRGILCCFFVTVPWHEPESRTTFTLVLGSSVLIIWISLVTARGLASYVGRKKAVLA